jgi:hypothetical protein
VLEQTVTSTLTGIETFDEAIAADTEAAAAVTTYVARCVLLQTRLLRCIGHRDELTALGMLLDPWEWRSNDATPAVRGRITTLTKRINHHTTEVERTTQYFFGYIAGFTAGRSLK